MGLTEKMVIGGLHCIEGYLACKLLMIGWVDRKNLTRREWIKVIIAIVLIGVGITISERNYPSFTYWTSMAEMSMVVLPFLFMEKKKSTGILLVINYVMFMRLVELLFFFFMLLSESGENNIWHGIMAAGCARLLVFWMLSAVQKREYEIKEYTMQYKNVLIVLAAGELVTFEVCKIIFKEFEENRQLNVTSTVLVLTAMAMILLFAFGIFQNNLQNEQEIRLAEVRGRMQEENYHQLADLMEENRERMHDMKHHIRALQTLTEEGDMEKIKGYLEHMAKAPARLEQMSWTDSRMLNVILNQKNDEAKKNGIQTRIQVSPEMRLPFDDFELCTVCGNLLDNAIEAAKCGNEDEKWMEVEILNRGDMVFMQISNSITEQPVRKNGIFITGKSDKQIHGLGLKSVKRIVRKHGGEMEINVEKDRFKVEIMFFDLERESS